MKIKISIIIAAAALCACAASNPQPAAPAKPVAIGDDRASVVQQIGQPDTTQPGRDGQHCDIYLDYRGQNARAGRRLSVIEQLRMGGEKRQQPRCRLENQGRGVLL